MSRRLQPLSFVPVVNSLCKKSPPPDDRARTSQGYEWRIRSCFDTMPPVIRTEFANNFVYHVHFPLGPTPPPPPLPHSGHPWNDVAAPEDSDPRVPLAHQTSLIPRTRGASQRSFRAVLNRDDGLSVLLDPGPPHPHRLRRLPLTQVPGKISSELLTQRRGRGRGSSDAPPRAVQPVRVREPKLYDRQGLPP
ncbi:hypothetical protein NMY22_g10172 [Coprinellus aureogranulatus]|nr:hypothetical protein NMY22_g10172 [Coprinellus aureogranulatus]